ncbi:putative glycosyltransferase EpsH [Methanobrevibacter filiformis]|uniref:Putative glycosyltransferase EpsH n=1 Tax=Methanobrevibacter filiformis TaxID=55758 RepID=A0A166CPF0_9EURY|nr:putative glycosyltransferase EpsH [Methanobrevibacter filiformis]
MNDGSTDNSLAILKKYAKKDKRIKIISKSNSGYGHTMNLGLYYATGDYIGIVEPDDYIDLNMYKILLNKAVKNNVDFIKADFQMLVGEGKASKLDYHKIANVEFYNKIIEPKKDTRIFNFAQSIWSGIYKRTFIKKHSIYFNETPGASFQDVGFCFQTLAFAKRAYFLNQGFYKYRIDNPNSSVHDKGKVFAINREHSFLLDFLNKNTDLKEKLIYVFQFRKFHHYIFALDRIGEEFKNIFIDKFHDEFVVAANNNQLKEHLFSKNDWIFLQTIINNPSKLYVMPTVSVIIPIYNSEQYLEECLNSIVNQTLKNIEIICVNDGSTDNSLEILEDYSKKDKRIKILNQENHGAGVARNKGLKIARGKYLSILDADDFFKPDMLEKMYCKSEEFNADIAICKSNAYNNESKEFFDTPGTLKNIPKKEVFDYKDIKKDVFTFSLGWSWDKLYKSSFVKNNNLNFQDLRSSNDLFFVFTSFVKAKRITTVPEVLATHRQNVNNSLSNTREKDPLSFYYAIKALKAELIELNLFEEVEESFINWSISFCFWHMDTNEKSDFIYSQFKNKISKELEFYRRSSIIY